MSTAEQVNALKVLDRVTVAGKPGVVIALPQPGDEETLILVRLDGEAKVCGCW